MCLKKTLNSLSNTLKKFISVGLLKQKKFVAQKKNNNFFFLNILKYSK